MTMKLMGIVAAACVTGALVGSDRTLDTAIVTTGAQASLLADTVRFDILLGGRSGSSLRWWRESDGTLTLLEETHDRGRGTRSRWQIRFDEPGTPLDITMAGRDEWGNPTSRSIAVRGDSVWWEVNGNRAVRGVHKGAFYCPWCFGSPLDQVVLAQALRSNRPVQVVRGFNSDPVPVSSRIVVRTRVSRGGQQLDLRLVGVVAGDRTVSRMWIDSAGGLFAIIGSGPVTIREGFEWAVPELIELQDSLIAPQMAAAARRAWQRSDGGLAITGANVIDVEAGAARAGMTVLVQGQRITGIGPDGTVPIPAGARMIDATGKSLLPGLWDMHRHVSAFRDDAAGRRALAEGITTQRDLLSTSFNTFDALRNLRRANANEIIGPRYIIAGGFIDGPGDFTAPTRAVASTLTEALRWVNTYADSGFEQIKVYNSLDRRLVPAIAQEAHRRGLRMSGHVPAYMTAEQAVNAGFDEIQHVHYLLLNFLGADTIDVRGTRSVDIVAARGATVDLGSARVARFLRLLRDRNIAIDVTLAWQEATFRELPAATNAERTAALNAFARMAELVGLLHRSGVRLLAGTDGRGTIARELELYTEAGISPIDAIRIATINAARHAKRDGQLGSIRVGKLADIILVSGNPLVDIRTLRQIELLIKDGAVLDMAALSTPLEW
jgi:imidazolonepropionase-like amidohydrolase